MSENEGIPTLGHEVHINLSSETGSGSKPTRLRTSRIPTAFVLVPSPTCRCTSSGWARLQSSWAESEIIHPATFNICICVSNNVWLDLAEKQTVGSLYKAKMKLPEFQLELYLTNYFSHTLSVWSRQSPYYWSQQVWICTMVLDFIFQILYLPPIPPEIFGISLYSTSGINVRGQPKWRISDPGVLNLQILLWILKKIGENTYVIPIWWYVIYLHGRKVLRVLWMKFENTWQNISNSSSATCWQLIHITIAVISRHCRK